MHTGKLTKAAGHKPGRTAQNRAMRFNAWMGAAGYPCLELLWRGRTHPTMALAGALGAGIIRRCGEMKGRPWKRAAMAAAGITGVELALGLLFNRQHQIWDYRRLKGNCMGQICPRYFCIWLLLARALLEEP